MTRHHLYVGTTAIACALATATLAGCGGASGSSASAGSGGSGQTLHVMLANHVWTDAVKKDLPAFEKKTGIKVDVTQLAEDQLAAQYKVKLNAGNSNIDVMMYRPLQVGQLFAKNGYFADLSKDVKSDRSWGWGDFQKGPVSLTTYKGKTVGVPMITECETLYYRKDLLKEAGLTVPKTMKELWADAKKIHKQNPGIAGFVSRTGRSDAVTQFSGFLYSFGGHWTNGNGKSAIDSPAAIKAYKFYGGLIHNFGPAQVSTDMSWPQSFAIFDQGKAAFLTDASSLYKNTLDPSSSKVIHDVGFAPLPAGPAGSKPYNVGSWALGISSSSNEKANAWKFIKWATSKTEMLKLQEAGVPGSRKSVWSNPKGTAGFPPGLVKTTNLADKTGVGFDRPVVVQVDQTRQAVGGPIVTAITGGDVASAAKTASASFQNILDAQGH